MQPDRPPAITLEEYHPLDYVGEEALAPNDKGLAPADEDQYPREDLTPGQLTAEGAGDMELSAEAEQ